MSFDNFCFRNVLKWGKNIGSAAKTRTKKRAGVAVYNRASSLETLVSALDLVVSLIHYQHLNFKLVDS